MAVFIACMTVVACVSAVGLECAVCHRAISGRYIKTDEGAFCSKRCYESTLPRCAVCGQVIRGRHLVSEGTHYCSDRCYDSTLASCEICGTALRAGVSVNGHTFCKRHADLPRCSRCGLPHARGLVLDDGRRLCTACRRGAIFDERTARRLYLQARQEVRALTGLMSPTLPPMALAGLDEIRDKLTFETSSHMVQRGLYSRTEHITTRRNVLGHVLEKNVTVDEQVLLLYGLHTDQMLTTAAHELTHDLIAEEFPEVRKNAPLWFEEGMCQYVAALVAKRHGYDRVLESIETCSDSVYGDGYRYVRSQVGHLDWRALTDYIARTDLARLPARAPR